MKAAAASVGLSLLGLVGAARATPTQLDWDQVFSLKGAPLGIHLQAHYIDGRSRAHELEIWRQGDARIRRRTDANIDLFAEKRADGETVLRVVDLKRQRLVDVSRTNLHRIGIFASFAALAGVPVRPGGTYRLTPGNRPRKRTAAGDCRWFRLDSPGAHAKEICWSERFKVALLIEQPTAKGGFTTLYQVDHVDDRVPPPSVFQCSTSGLTVIAADQDIDPSGD